MDLDDITAKQLDDMISEIENNVITNEKRKEKRNDIILPIKFMKKSFSTDEFIEDISLKHGELINISSSGMGMVTDNAFPIGSTVYCEVENPNSILKLEITISNYSRLERDPRYGCEIKKIIRK